MYPSIQAKIWGNIGMVSDLFDMVLDSFIKVGVSWGCFHGAGAGAGEGAMAWTPRYIRTCLLFTFYSFVCMCDKD